MATEVVEIGDDGEISILYTTPIGFKSTAAKITIDLTQGDVEILPSTSKRRRLPKSELSDDTVLRLSFTCKICTGVKPMSDSFLITTGCDHSYCTQCISNYVAAKVQDCVTTINCPAPGCGELLEPHHCRTILPKEVFDRWGEAMILGAEKLHPGIDLKEFDEKVRADERSNEDMFINLPKDWIKCPLGQLYISKSGGCYFVSCRCGHRWCYHCKGLMGYGVPHVHGCPFWVPLNQRALHPISLPLPSFDSHHHRSTAISVRIEPAFSIASLPLSSPPELEIVNFSKGHFVEIGAAQGSRTKGHSFPPSSTPILLVSISVSDFPLVLSCAVVKAVVFKVCGDELLAVEQWRAVPGHLRCYFGVVRVPTECACKELVFLR